MFLTCKILSISVLDSYRDSVICASNIFAHEVSILPIKIDVTSNLLVKSADGNYYAVADGKVYPKPSNLNSDTGDIELSYTEKITAMFGYDDNMGAHPGVDAYSDEKKAFAAQYDHYQLHSDDAYATWMAKDGSRAAIAKMTMNGGDPSAVQVRSGGQTVTGFGGSDPNALYLPLITDGLYEAYYTTKDKKGKDVEVVAGQLNVATYPQQQINLCLVGVNGAHYPYSTAELSNQLNTIFAQAITKVNVSTANIDVDKFNGTLSARESGALSAYNKDMKQLIRKVKKLSDYNSDTYYLLLVEQSDNSALAGFMPLNSQFGFVFTKANTTSVQLNRTIAHELGHGAFRLWHTFSGENLYTAQQGTTQNLMDYNGTAAELYKYQWDYIHNPQQGIVRWMVEEEEDAVIVFKHYEISTAQLHNIYPNASTETIKAVTEAINKYCNEFEINTPERMAHFLGQIGAETGDKLDALSENSNYSARRIVEIFGYTKYGHLFEKAELNPQTYNYTYVPIDYSCTLCANGAIDKNGSSFSLSRSEILNAYAEEKTETELTINGIATKKMQFNDMPRTDVTASNIASVVKKATYNEGRLRVKTQYINSVTLFDVTYACRMGNGAIETRDGSAYKGVGFIHLTGKSNYKSVVDEWNKMHPDNQLTLNHELLERAKTDIDLAMKLAMAYWKKNALNTYIGNKNDVTNDDILKISAIVNIGHTKNITESDINGYDKRKNATIKSYNILNEK